MGWISFTESGVDAVFGIHTADIGFGIKYTESRLLENAVCAADDGNGFGWIIYIDGI